MEQAARANDRPSRLGELDSRRRGHRDERSVQLHDKWSTLVGKLESKKTWGTPAFKIGRRFLKSADAQLKSVRTNVPISCGLSC